MENDLIPSVPLFHWCFWQLLLLMFDFFFEYSVSYKIQIYIFYRKVLIKTHKNGIINWYSYYISPSRSRSCSITVLDVYMTTEEINFKIRYISATNNSCSFVFSSSAWVPSEDSIKPGEHNDLSRPQDWQPIKKEGKKWAEEQLTCCKVQAASVYVDVSAGWSRSRLFLINVCSFSAGVRMLLPVLVEMLGGALLFTRYFSCFFRHVH